jgi:hypothetical protein
MAMLRTDTLSKVAAGRPMATAFDAAARDPASTPRSDGG